MVRKCTLPDSPVVEALSWLPDPRLYSTVHFMAIQTSIVLPDELAAELNRRALGPEERSALVAEALRCFFATHRSMKDELEVLNLHADELNREAEDVLDYQVIP